VTTTVPPEVDSTGLERREVGEPVDGTFELKPWAKPTDDWDSSPYSSTVSAQDYPMYVTLAQYGANHEDQELFEPFLMAESKLVEDNTVWRVKLSDEGFTWHDGSDVHIRDRYNHIKYDELRREKFGNERQFKEVRLVDDRTMEHVLHNKQHPISFLGSARPDVQYHRDFYKPHLEAIQDATTSREAFKVHSEFEKVSISPEEWTGHGQFKISDVGENRVLYDRYEDFPEPYKSYQNIQQLKVPIRSGESAARLLIQNEATDWYNGLPDGLRKGQLADRYQLTQKKTTKQYVFRYNHNNKHLARLGVRRAIAYLKRFGPVAQNDVGIYVDKYQDGTTEAIGEEWIPGYQERAQNYIDYGDGTTPKTQAAEQALKNEGYERNGDNKWVGPDGDLLEIDIVAPWWFTERAQTMVSWMQEFGFTSSLEDPGVFWQQYSSYENDWDIIVGFHSRGPNHPASSFKNDDGWGTKMTEINQDGERVPVGNREIEVEIPTEVGATDLSGDTEVINVAELQATISNPESSAEDLVEPFKKLTRWWNYWLPDLIAAGGYFNFLGDYQDFQWLDWDGDRVGEAKDPYRLSHSLNAGYIRGKEK
jgi:hypothetical protein